MDDDNNIVGATTLQSDDWEDIADESCVASDADFPGENVFNYMGIPLREVETSTMQGMNQLADSEYVIFFQVDGLDSSVSNEQIAREWLAQLRNRRELPQYIDLSSESSSPLAEKRKRPLQTQSKAFECDYLRSLGDEWSIEREPARSQYIGDKFLGRVWLAPKQE